MNELVYRFSWTCIALQQARHLYKTLSFFSHVFPWLLLTDTVGYLHWECRKNVTTESYFLEQMSAVCKETPVFVSPSLSIPFLLFPVYESTTWMICWFLNPKQCHILCFMYALCFQTDNICHIYFNLFKKYLVVSIEIDRQILGQVMQYSWCNYWNYIVFRKWNMDIPFRYAIIHTQTCRTAFLQANTAWHDSTSIFQCSAEWTGRLGCLWVCWT